MQTIRKATKEDLDLLSSIENECFPASQACTKEQFQGRLKYYPDCFRILEIDGIPVGFIDGFCTDEDRLTDEMYEHPEMHDPNGAYQMIFGVNTVPSQRHKGYASLLIRHVIEQAAAEGRKGVILTCEKQKIGFYERFGFENQGRSVSVHGDTVWYQMIRRI